jgi:hypothetical protein
MTNDNKKDLLGKDDLEACILSKVIIRDLLKEIEQKIAHLLEQHEYPTSTKDLPDDVLNEKCFNDLHKILYDVNATALSANCCSENTVGRPVMGDINDINFMFVSL